MKVSIGIVTRIATGRNLTIHIIVAVHAGVAVHSKMKFHATITSTYVISPKRNM